MPCRECRAGFAVLYVQVLVNGLVLGGLYSAIAVGFSLVWGVLNVINILHGSLIILGSYAAFFAYQYLNINPFLFVPAAACSASCSRSRRKRRTPSWARHL